MAALFFMIGLTLTVCLGGLMDAIYNSIRNNHRRKQQRKLVMTRHYDRLIEDRVKEA